MANRCQLCEGQPKVAVEDWRSIWLGDFYLEWGRCCNDKPFPEDLRPSFTDGQTGEEFSPETPQEMWAKITGQPDAWGEALW